MDVQEPQRPYPQYAPTMSGAASSAFTALSGGMNGNIGFQGLPQSASQPGYPEINNMASSLGLFFSPQGLGQQGQEPGRTTLQGIPGAKAATAEVKAGGSAYATRHQAAEQRRRTRINERLDKLRTLCPHAERANTASFLEEVIHYIEELQAIIGLAPQQRPPSGMGPMKISQPMEFSQLPGALYGSAGGDDFTAVAAAGGGVTSAAYAALAHQQQVQGMQAQAQAQAQQQQQQQQHAHQGSMEDAGGVSGLTALNSLTVEQASMLAHQGGLGEFSPADIAAMLANARGPPMQGVSHAGHNLNGEPSDGGGLEHLGSGAGLGNLAAGSRSARTKQPGDPSTPTPHGPLAGAATDSDGSDGRPLKKRANR